MRQSAIAMLRLAAAWLIALLAAGSPYTDAFAASLQLAPTSLTLPPAQSAGGLWISNTGTDTVQVQARVYAWTQHDGEETLQPTDTVMISPPMRALAPGERQLIRFVRRTPTPPSKELAYRVIVDELPTPNTQRSGMQFVLRYSVPVFVLPTTPAAPLPEPQMRLVTDGDGTRLEVRNSGSLHAQLADLSYADAAHTTSIKGGLVGYVLAGQTMRWSLPEPADTYADGTFSARINGDAAPIELPRAPATP